MANKPHHPFEVTPIRHHLLVFRRFGIYIVASVVATTALAVVGSALLPRTYESRASVYIGQPLNDAALDYNGVLASQLLAKTFARIALTEPVLGAVRQQLALDLTLEELRARVRTDLPLDETVLTIITQSEDASEAAAMANAVVEQLKEQAPPDPTAERTVISNQLATLDVDIGTYEQEIENLLSQGALSADEELRLGALQRRFDSLTSRYQAIAGRILPDPPSTLNVIQTASVPATPVAPRRALITGAAAFTALAAAVAFANVAYALADSSAQPPRRRGRR